MRPGPGLVVMALAFISGARRGSTSTSTSSKSSSSTTSTSAFFTSNPLNISPEPTTPSLLFPAYLGGGGALKADSETSSNHLQTEIDRNKYRKVDYNYIYNSLYVLTPYVTPRERTTLNDHHLRLETLSGLKASSRATRQTRRIRSLSLDERNQNEDTESVDDNGDISVGDNVSNRNIGIGSESGSGYEIEGEVIAVEDKTSESKAVDGSRVAGDSRGLPVQFLANSADGSQSLDEDDILALVAEDDLLSEESFDRLSKFADDKIGYVVVDDYDAAIKDTTSSVSHKSFTSAFEKHQRYPNADNYTANEKNTGNENGSGENDKFQNEQEHTNEKPEHRANINANVNNNIKERVYAKNIENKHESLAAAADISYVAALSENGLSHIIATNSHSSVRNNKWSIFASESPLTRLNPWISACDLAQPGTAPDLQGQCSAGTLPVAWVDEGPGPPACPLSCERIKSSVVNNFNTKSNNNNSNLLNNYKFNLKTSTKNHHETGKILKMRRNLNLGRSNDSIEVSKGDQDLDRSEITEKSSVSSASFVNMKSIQAKQFDNLEIAPLPLTSGIRQHQVNNNIVKVNNNHGVSKMSYANSGYSNVRSIFESSHMYGNEQKQHYTGYREQQQPLQQLKHQKQQKEQQCLDYLGDTEETSPAHLCTFKSPGELAIQLRSLRLRHCCERNVFSALHTVALNATLSGGVECVRILMDIMDLDLLATRITCELAEILFRFDCRQVYSLIHQCDDCKEAYRRWVCSTLVPYFAEESDISVAPSNNNNNNRNNFKNDNRTNHTSTNNSDKMIVNDITSNKTRRFSLNGKNINKLQSSMDSGDREKQRNKRQLSRNLTISKHSMHGSDIAHKSDQSAALKRSTRSLDDRCNRYKQQQQQQVWQQGQQKHSKQSKQSNIFISTAINGDPCTEDPVISKIIKRSKRKVQFRKRRRIRPCLSVCQTVEQKCPYMLPADRAPALPTQYAGEPTFLCLDQSIPETGEQLRKSSYGPTECCYSYCNNIMDGICAYCIDFIQDAMNVNITVERSTRLHNITITATSEHRLDARLEASLANNSANKLAASISIALSNSSANAVGAQIDRLPYYALYDGVYYYDENTADMPEAAMSDDCPPVPSVTSRCSIPYYASSAVAVHTKKKSVPNDVLGHHMLLLLSAMLCFLTSHTASCQLKNQTQNKLRKSILHRSKLTNFNRLSSGWKHHRSAAIYMVNKYTYLVLQSTEYRQQQLLTTKEYTVERKTRGQPTMPTIFPISTMCTYYSSSFFESDSIRHCVHIRGGRVHCCTKKAFGRNRSRNKNKYKNGSRKLNTNRNRNNFLNGNQIRNMTGNEDRISISRLSSELKKLKKKKNASIPYSGCVAHKYVQMNIGYNKKHTYRLNSKLYFNSNTKIYRRTKCSKFINFNIATITDYNKNYNNVINSTTTSNTIIYYYNYNTNNYNYNNTISSIARFKFYNTEKKCQFIYYYNFNINDWWRRWTWFPYICFDQRRSSIIL